MRKSLSETVERYKRIAQIVVCFGDIRIVGQGGFEMYDGRLVAVE